MSQNQSKTEQTDRARKPAAGAGSSKAKSAPGSKLIQLQRMAGNQAVTGLIPVQRSVTEALEEATEKSTGDEEVAFLKGLATAVGSAGGPINDQLNAYTSHGGRRTDESQAEKAAEKADKKAAKGDIQAGDTDSITVPKSDKERKELEDKLDAQIAGTYTPGKKDADADRIKRKQQQAKLAYAKRKAEGKLTPAEQQAAAQQAKDEAEAKELKELEAKEKSDTDRADKKKKFDLLQKQLKGEPLTAEEQKLVEADKQAKEDADMDKKMKLMADELASKNAWAGLANMDPKDKAKYGALDDGTQSALNDSEAEYQKMQAAAKTQVDQVQTGTPTPKKKKSLWDSVPDVNLNPLNVYW